jgi:predicted transposase YdaD
MPIRMCSYSIRLQWEYELPVRQVLIWLVPTSNQAVFETEFRTEFTHHRYQVIRLWEESPEPLLENNALLPLAVLCATQNPTELLSQVAQEVGKIEDTDQRQEIAACTQILAGLRFDKQLISTMFREEIMQESVVYQDILQKGIAQGLEQGLEQGEKQGEVAVILRQLHRFCGLLNLEIKSRIQSLSKPQLEELSEALLDFTNLADLQQWLDSH